MWWKPPTYYGDAWFHDYLGTASIVAAGRLQSEGLPSGPTDFTSAQVAPVGVSWSMNSMNLTGHLPTSIYSAGAYWWFVVSWPGCPVKLTVPLYTSPGTAVS